MTELKKGDVIINFNDYLSIFKNCINDQKMSIHEAYEMTFKFIMNAFE